MTESAFSRGIEDEIPISWAPWLTAKRAILFVLMWLSVVALGSVALSNPFQSEPSAVATPNYANVMFLHGLLIGMVGLISLLVLQVLRMRSMHTRAWIVGGVVAATVLATLGGIWDRSIPGSEVPMWTQIFGFFALDEILIVLVWGIWSERGRAGEVGRIPLVASLAAATSMLGAAIMGHLAGWIMEFGEGTPAVIGSYRSAVGFGSQDDFTGALVGSHSHEMAVASMAMAATALTVQFGYSRLSGGSRLVARIGLGLLAAGTVLMTAFYLVTGFTTWAPPDAVATVGAAPNQIPLDDLLTGVLVMGGGVVAMLAFLPRLMRVPVRLAAAWSFVLATATVAVAGYTIELNTSHFGAGDPKAPGAAADAIFTWLHQDIGLFLLPTVLVVMLFADRLVAQRRVLDAIGWAGAVGTTALFAGGMVWVFVDPVLRGPGYLISTLGVIVIGAAVVATVWYAGLRSFLAGRLARDARPGPIPG